MIRINLLPVRASKKKETAVQQIAIFIISIVVALVIVLSFWAVKLGQISSTRNDINAANAKIAELKSKIGKLDELKKLKEEVKKKLDVLETLRKNKTGPASRLATLSDVTPEQVWLEKYKETGTGVSLTGIAFNEELIAQYIRALEASPSYQGVELVVSEQKNLETVKLKGFELKFAIEQTAGPVAKPEQVSKVQPVQTQPKK